MEESNRIDSLVAGAVLMNSKKYSEEVVNQGRDRQEEEDSRVLFAEGMFPSHFHMNFQATLQVYS